MEAIFYGVAPVTCNSEIIVTRSVRDVNGLLIIAKMHSVDTGISWQSTTNPPPIRIASAEVTGYPKRYKVNRVEIECSATTSQTKFQLEEIGSA